MFNPLTWFVDPLMEVANLLNGFGQEYWGLLLVLLVLSRAMSNLVNNSARLIDRTHLRMLERNSRSTLVRRDWMNPDWDRNRSLDGSNGI